ncbi:hypothetical protein L3Q82_016861 [Scortum barcoo]|uniref:Uncharacterized protein n=1 Tax=Scortum barcoo TaxID=214431 RepID=A0ACB8X8R8_9TELE|nr:hypothetical protein L3Q82_016861 [Scortum barcoo]
MKPNEERLCNLLKRALSYNMIEKNFYKLGSVVEKTFSSPPPPYHCIQRGISMADLSLPVVEPEQHGGGGKEGLRAGVLVRLRKRENRPPLPSILLANVQSLDNKLDELRSRMAFQRDIKRILVFTETWLDPSIPDSCHCSRGSFHPPTGPDNSFREEQGRRCLLHGEQQVVLRTWRLFLRAVLRTWSTS